MMFLHETIGSEGGSKQVVKRYGTNTDVEDRKRDEDVRRASEQSSRLLLDIAALEGFFDVCRFWRAKSGKTLRHAESCREPTVAVSFNDGSTDPKPEM
jgi:hypothetical protein